jgi:hypothetical protein
MVATPAFNKTGLITCNKWHQNQVSDWKFEGSQYKKKIMAATPAFNEMGLITCNKWYLQGLQICWAVTSTVWLTRTQYSHFILQLICTY